VSRDSHRAAVYDCEALVSAVLDRGGPVDFHGSTLDVGRDVRFGDIASVRRWLAWVREMSWGYGDTPPVTVRERKGTARAHWEPPGTIAIPTSGSRFAMRALVVTHEYAHHVTHHRHHDAAAHGSEFRAVYCDLVERAISPEAALLLRDAFHNAGLSGVPRC